MSAKNPFKQGGMFEGASYRVFGLAKDLRRNMTDAEKLLWGYLKNGVCGCKFRRQHPIGIYIADFFCHKAKLIVEADGSIHDKPEIVEKDKKRQAEIESWGYTVIRFRNEEIIKDIASVLKRIEEKVEHLKQK